MSGKLSQYFEDLSIETETIRHPAFFTVEEGRTHKAEMPGGHSKNLFLRDKKKIFYLVVAWCDTAVDLVDLGKRIGAKGRLSFGSADKMAEILGVEPGSVTPFALIHDGASEISRVIVDERFMAFDRVWFHPLKNTASTSIAPGDLLLFIEACGHEPIVMDLGTSQDAKSSEA
ncbi:MAG: prolyl-tRNA synthetase associated domain-containing protein [Pseudomonadota bacterium]